MDYNQEYKNIETVTKQKETDKIRQEEQLRQLHFELAELTAKCGEIGIKPEELETNTKEIKGLLDEIIIETKKILCLKN